MRTPAKTPAVNATGLRGATLARQCKRCGETFDTYATKRPPDTCKECRDVNQTSHPEGTLDDVPYLSLLGGPSFGGRGLVCGFDYGSVDRGLAGDDEQSAAMGRHARRRRNPPASMGRNQSRREGR